MNKKMTVLATLYLCGMGLFCADVALAGQDQYVLTYSKIELTNDAGRQAVYGRIVRAATTYCPSYAQIRSIRDVQLCIDGVVSDLIGKVENDDFQAYVNGERSPRTRIAEISEWGG